MGQVELVTQERNVATSIGALNYPVFMENLYTLGVHITPDHRLVNVEPVDTASGSSSSRITLRNVFTNQTSERIVDQIIVEHGTVPCDDIYHDLLASSKNNGVVDWKSVNDASKLFPVCNPEREYILFRVGDAISSRNIHAAMYDSLRL